MKTSKLVICLGAFLLITCFVSCTHREKHTYCENFTNKDSLIQRILTEYDVEAFEGLWCCHVDTNMDLYGFLVSDSSGMAGLYMPTYYSYGSGRYGLNDTIALFYETKGFVMGCYTYFKGDHPQQINFPDSIYNVLDKEFNRYGVSVWDIDKYRSEYNNLDSLLGVVLRTEDVASYDKLRLLVSADSLLPVAIEMADKTHYPIACYDVYYSSVQGLRLPQDEFNFAYKYLNEAADSMYYPAVYLKACLCLTGAYFPPDTILGKKLLEQCHGSTSIPFWQQYYKPVVYGHLLNTKEKVE